jgi:hypothetical protein
MLFFSVLSLVFKLQLRALLLQVIQQQYVVALPALLLFRRQVISIHGQLH